MAGDKRPLTSTCAATSTRYACSEPSGGNLSQADGEGTIPRSLQATFNPKPKNSMAAGGGELPLKLQMGQATAVDPNVGVGGVPEGKVRDISAQKWMELVVQTWRPTATR